jgi:hypothetical protein
LLSVVTAAGQTTRSRHTTKGPQDNPKPAERRTPRGLLNGFGFRGLRPRRKQPGLQHATGSTPSRIIGPCCPPSSVCLRSQSGSRVRRRLGLQQQHHDLAQGVCDVGHRERRQRAGAVAVASPLAWRTQLVLRPRGLLNLHQLRPVCGTNRGHRRTELRARGTG